jgi:hypothetical protein
MPQVSRAGQLNVAVDASLPLQVGDHVGVIRGEGVGDDLGAHLGQVHVPQLIPLVHHTAEPPGTLDVLIGVPMDPLRTWGDGPGRLDRASPGTGHTAMNK